jgi:hypothetical protein
MATKNINTEMQREFMLKAITAQPIPFQVSINKVTHPKTLSQIKYMHSLCQAMATHYNVTLEAAKRDSKAEYGVVTVAHSLITGQRNARLESFKDYSKEQAEAYITCMEQYLSENLIEFIGAGENEPD